MKFKEIRSYLLSPALPAVGLLFGMVFCLAFARFTGLYWQLSATIMLYGVLAVWTALLAWRQRRLWNSFGVIDALFGVFILLVLVSIVMQGALTTAAWKYVRYLPFMAIAPYVCGRLMGGSDIRLLSRIIALGGMVMLVLLVIDYWQNIASIQNYERYYSRWPFFGLGHGPLLVGVFLAGSMVTWTFFSQAEEGDTLRLFSLRKVGTLLALGLVSGGLVATAARGAVLAGLLSTFSVILLVQYWSLSRKCALILYLVTVMVFTHTLLPKAQAQVYTNLRNESASEWIGEGFLIRKASKLLFEAKWSFEPIKLDSKPILGEESCRPIQKGIDSLAVRRVLWQEAIAMFINWPLWGTGAATFGWYSCSGEMGFPHSTVLHVIAELGTVGGLVFVGLMACVCIRFARKAVESTATADTLAAQLALALFLVCLVTDQIYGNYFLATGSYLLAGVAAGMRSNSSWSDGIRENDVE